MSKTPTNTISPYELQETLRDLFLKFSQIENHVSEYKSELLNVLLLAIDKCPSQREGQNDPEHRQIRRSQRVSG